VEERNRTPVTGTWVSLLRTDSTLVDRAFSDAWGFFQLRAPESGTYVLRAERDGYDTQTRQINLAGTGEISIPAFVLISNVITLDKIDIGASRGKISDPPVDAVGFRRASHVAAGTRMRDYDRAGVSPFAVALSLGAGLRVRSVLVGSKWIQCIESSRRITDMNSDGGCNPVVVVLNGAPIMDPIEYLERHVQVADLESMEYLPPAEAGMRYGLDASARGALILWTRGSGPYKSAERD
jgi:hypothetical protein